MYIYKGMKHKTQIYIMILKIQIRPNKNYYYLIQVMLLKLIQNNYHVNAVYQKGKHFLEEEKSFLCVACGNISCSSECHQQYFSQQDECTFYQNFTKESNIHTLPSIVSKNIQISQKNKLPIGKILNKTSENFIMAYNHSKQNWIYLQRGYRQYGNPIQETFNYFNVFQNRNIDYYKLKKRTCICNCISCSDRFEHSVLNCSKTCDIKDSKLRFSLNEVFDYNELDEICTCKCEICSSGIINTTHQLKDCFDNCLNSNLLDRLENQ